MIDGHFVLFPGGFLFKCGMKRLFKHGKILVNLKGDHFDQSVQIYFIFF